MLNESPKTDINESLSNGGINISIMSINSTGNLPKPGIFRMPVNILQKKYKVIKITQFGVLFAKTPNDTLKVIINMIVINRFNMSEPAIDVFPRIAIIREDNIINIPNPIKKTIKYPIILPYRISKRLTGFVIIRSIRLFLIFFPMESEVKERAIRIIKGYNIGKQKNLGSGVNKARRTIINKRMAKIM